MKRFLVLAVAIFALLSGCSRAPRVVEPVAPSDLAALVNAINTAAPGAASYRGTGNGEITVSGRTIKVAFALVYERPGWLRADLRLPIVPMAAPMTALALMEGECARIFLPARLLVVTGCIPGVAGGDGELDAASLILGLPDASFITRMTEVTTTRRRGLLILEGLAGDSRVRVKIDEERSIITEIEVGREGTDRNLRLSYSGHGWKAGTSAPRTVELVALEGESGEMGITIRYETLRGGESIDRGAYDLKIPPDVLEIDWRELSFWR